MVQVDPVILEKLVLENLGVPHFVIRDLGVLHHERDGIVPRKRVRSDIDGNFRGLLQTDRVHVVVLILHLGIDSACLRSAELLEDHSANPALL